ncbi:cupin domain-containing protein [Arthrobacter sp. MDT2-16]
MSAPLFPGGTAISNLRVYEWEADDGHHGGSPHVHTVSSEAYVVMGGTGEAHTLSSGGACVDILEPGTVLWFSPGTVHRLVNTGALEILTVMGNSGLPEAGDAVMTFPLEIVKDPDAYLQASTLPSQGSAHERESAARTRRDLALRGYHDLHAAVEKDGPGALSEFHRAAAELVRPKVEQWRRLWSSTVEAETERTRGHLESLAQGNGMHLADASVVHPIPRPEPRLFGMCGRLQTWQVPA